jgi:hypothetical protein
MTPEDRLLLACTRQDFAATHAETICQLDAANRLNWNAILRTATLHSVAPLVYYNIKSLVSQLSIPGPSVEQLRSAYMRNMMVKEVMGQHTEHAVAYFQQFSINSMLVKGAALDIQVYEQPCLTTMQDIDIVLGVRRSQVNDEQFTQFMKKFHNTGIEYDFFGHHDIGMNGLLKIDFEDIWQRTQMGSFRGQPIWLMSPEDLLLSVCINSCRKRFFRLKSLCDIAETIRVFPQLHWDSFCENAVLYGCHHIVYAALLVSQKTVGCSLPGNLRQKLKVSRVRSQLLERIIDGSSLAAFDSLESGRALFGRRLSWALALPYLTLNLPQTWRRVKFALLFEYRGERRESLRLQ